MSISEKLIEKWYQCRESRYPVLLIITAPADTLFSDNLIHEFADKTSAKVLNFISLYQGQLGEFFTWRTIRDQIYKEAKEYPVIVTDLEPIYSKWPVDERLTFIKNILRSEPPCNITVLLNCQEDLSTLKQIEPNSRGVVWVPS